MMADWQVGDLALCVRGGHIKGSLQIDSPKAGQVVEVEILDFMPTTLFPSGTLVIGSKLLPPNIDGSHRWGASRFIKVTPPAADEDDREVIALLTGKPVEVGA